MSKIKSILHPTDFSPRSTQAFELACSLARDHGARLMVLHVIERPLMIEGGVMMAPAPPPIPPAEREAAQAKLRQIKPADPKLQVEYRLEEGDPATGIFQVAEECKCDLIVVGTHGRSGLARLLMGSVAEKVLRNATCPVLTVKSVEHK